jgi:hypothetical protein
MRTTTTLLHIGAACALLALSACKPHGDDAQRKTKFPGMVTADGGTSGQVMAAHGGPKTNAAYAGGTPGIAGGAGGNTSGAATGGTTQETGHGPNQGVTPPSGASGHLAGPQGTIQSESGDHGTPAAPSAAEQQPAPAAAHRDPAASQAAPGR